MLDINNVNFTLDEICKLMSVVTSRVGEYKYLCERYPDVEHFKLQYAQWKNIETKISILKA